MREPSPQAMKIAHRRILDLEVLGGIQFGDESWKIISEMIAEIETLYDPLVDARGQPLKPFDFDTLPSSETIEMLKSKGYSVKETERGWYPTHPMGAIIRGWAKTEQDAWRHCYKHYDQIKAKEWR